MGIPIDRIEQLCSENNIDIKNLERNLTEIHSKHGLNFPNNTIRRWPGAKKLPPYEKVKAVADYFHVSISWISYGAYPDESESSISYSIILSPQEIDMIKLFRKADDRDKEYILHLLDRYREDTVFAAV